MWASASPCRASRCVPGHRRAETLTQVCSFQLSCHGWGLERHRASGRVRRRVLRVRELLLDHGRRGGVSIDIDCDDEDDFERETTDFGLVFGGEVQIDVGESLVLLIDGRYNLGLRDLGAGGEDESVKGRAFSIMARAGIKVN